MKKIVLAGSLIASMFAAQTAFAQEEAKKDEGQLTIGGQVRPRFEFRNGFKRPVYAGHEPSAFMEQRARVNMMYKKSNFNVKISVQDVRIWGEVGQINKTDGLTSFHEAYGEWTPSKNFALRVGRQELVYDDARILGNLGWAAQGRSHDAAKLVFKDSTSEFHTIFTYNQDALVPEPAKLQNANAGLFTSPRPGVPSDTVDVNFALPNPLATQILWYKKNFKGGNISFLALNDLTQIANTNGSHGVVARVTTGTNFMYKAGDIKLNGILYAQFGKNSATQKSLAGMASLSATYTGSKKVIPTLGFDYLSGDDTSSTDVNEAFNPLYGTHHKFYGLMDYFYVGNGHGNRGLVDIYAKSVFKLGKPGKLLVHLHGFLSAAENYNRFDFLEDGSENSEKYLGTEIDLVYVKPLTKGLTFKAGTSFMFDTDAMAHIKNAPVKGNGEEFNTIGMNNWTWAMIDFKF